MVREKHDPLIRVSRRAMACPFEVCFPAARCEDGTQLAIKSLDLVDTLEKQLSFFQPTSLICVINRLAAHAPVEVEPWLFDLLALATRLHEQTGGAYDITSAPLWEAWGFARRAGKIPSDDQLAEARSHVGSHLLELDSDRRTVSFRSPGVRISLGSIGKGYALDVCGRWLLESGMDDFLLHGGQSSVLARGFLERRKGDKSNLPERPATNLRSMPGCAQIGPVPFSPWEIGISDPRRPGRRLGIVRLHDRALGTSASQFQSFRHRGRRYGHVLDPRTGWPADGVLSTTVVAPTAALADALSTAFHVMGSADSLAYCQTHPEIGMVMVCPGHRGADAEFFSAGLDESELSL